MIPILYESGTTSFNNSGIGRLSDCISCLVFEERNGIFEVEFEYPISGRYYSEIREGRIITASHDEQKDLQPFIIYSRSAEITGVVKFYCHHISYLLSNIIVKPFSAVSVADAFSAFTRDNMNTNPFTFWTDNATGGDISIGVPSSIRSVMGGSTGTILDVFGGEYEYDNFLVRNYASRGADNGVTIRYGKNLLKLNQNVDAEYLYNAVVPYWSDGESTVVYGGVVAATGQTASLVSTHDMSQDFTEQPTVLQLNAAARTWLDANRPWIPKETLKIDFVALWQTEEYKDIAPLERVRLCDTVTVLYPELGVEATAKVIKVIWNALAERYESVEIGDARSSFADTVLEEATADIGGILEGVVTTSMMGAAIDHATELITGGLGGHIVFLYDANGKPTDMLVMDTEDVNTAVHVLRINVNGIGFSSTGVSGPYTSAWTLDGQFVADFITAGYLICNRIRGGTLTLGGSADGNGVLSVVNSSDTEVVRLDKDGINIKDGSIHIPYSGTYSANDGITISETTPLEVKYTPSSGRTITMNFDSAGKLHFGQANLTRSTNITNGIIEVFGTYSSQSDYANIAVYSAYDAAHSTYSVNLSSTELRFFKNSTSGTYMTESKLYMQGLCIFEGTKSRAVDTEDYGKRLLYCYETPSPMFADVGEGTIAEDGKCYVFLDSIFSETITSNQYQVFLQKYGDGDCYVSERNAQCFIVEGTPGLSFAWEIKAKQSDFDQYRLENYLDTEPVKQTDYGAEAQIYIENLKGGRIAA